MKLVKQSHLFFREGNSDKEYIIELLKHTEELFSVNFKYGRRGAVLKEGTKTEKPITLAAAELIFNKLETEKRKKGYLSESELLSTLPNLDSLSPDLQKHPILQRLDGAIKGTSVFKTYWKTSRVIWKAGGLKMMEAEPFVSQLVFKGDKMQQYAALWTLVRLKSINSITIFKRVVENPKSTLHSRRVAKEGLLQMLEGDELTSLQQEFVSKLPIVFQENLLDAITLKELLESQLSHADIFASSLENLYYLSFHQTYIRELIIPHLKKVGISKKNFKEFRYLFKIAELRSDFEVYAILAHKFERADGFGNTSKVFSNKTKAYFLQRVIRQIYDFGKENPENFIQLSVSILLSYDKQNRDLSPSNKLFLEQWFWRIKLEDLPPFADAILLNLILHGGGTRLIRYYRFWMIAEARSSKKIENRAFQMQRKQQQTKETFIGSIFKSILKIFGNSNQESTVVHDSTNSIPQNSLKSKNKGREELYPQHWDKFPHAYLALILRSEVDLIHGFALERLLEHPEYQTIINQLSVSDLVGLVSSEIEPTINWATDLISERLQVKLEKTLVIGLLNANSSKGQELGKQFFQQYLADFLMDTDSLLSVIYANHFEIRHWIKGLLQEHTLHKDVLNSLIDLAVLWLANQTDNSADCNMLLNQGNKTLQDLAVEQIMLLSDDQLNALQLSPIVAVKLFALKIIILKNQLPNASVLAELICSDVKDNRKLGEGIFNSLLNKPVFLVEMVNELYPKLFAKEHFEGQHLVVQGLLSNSLRPYLSKINIAHSLRLIHGNYIPAQEIGWILLTEQIDKDRLLVKQVVHLASHNDLRVRQWSWSWFDKKVSVAKVEKEETIKLLQSKWDDTRQFTIDFLRKNFVEEDWSPEVLIGIVDSVKPDVEAFGRELITNFYEEGNGLMYLSFLCQHPSLNVQLFVSNFIEKYAANNIEKLQDLDYYFRSVLMRVNKGRNTKNRVFHFLHQEAMRSQEAACVVSNILSDVSATVAIEDKAKCIQIMRDLEKLYPSLLLPMTTIEFETR